MAIAASVVAKRDELVQSARLLGKKFLDLWSSQWSSEAMQGHHRFQCRVGQARFERRPTIGKRREFMVGRRGEAPLVSHPTSFADRTRRLPCSGPTHCWSPRR